ncbi:hypothetical protein V8D89_014897 [Ganoderma adspersum]
MPLPLLQSFRMLVNFYQDTLTSSSHMDSLEASLNAAMSGYILGFDIDHPLLSASAFFSTSFAAEYYVVVALALVVYDWLINLDDEIRCFWAFKEGGPKLKAGTVLYTLSRYPPIVQLALSVRTDMPMSSTECRINSGLQTAMLASYVLAPARMAVLVGVYVVRTHRDGLMLKMLTFAAISTSSLQIATRVCSIAGDLLVLFVTWSTTYTSCKMQRGVLRGPSLMRVMLHNAILICCPPLHQPPCRHERHVHDFATATMVPADLIALLFQPVETALFQTFATSVVSPLTAILTCRFLLDLHHVTRSATPGPTSTTFAPSLGSMSLGLDLAALEGAEPQPEGSLPTVLPPFIASMGEEVHMGPRFTSTYLKEENAGAAVDVEA